MAKAQEKKPLFVDQGKWAAGLSNSPVFIDGLSHELFYLIVATKTSAENYEAVVVGKFGSDSFKVKMYGSFEDWGFTASSLSDKFRAASFRSRNNPESDSYAGYQRYMTDRHGVALILEALQKTRNVTVCPVLGVMEAFNTPGDIRQQVADALHPVRGGMRPKIPFSPPALLGQEATA